LFFPSKNPISSSFFLKQYRFFFFWLPILIDILVLMLNSRLTFIFLLLIFFFDVKVWFFLMFLTWVFWCFVVERKRKIDRERCKARWCVEGVQVYCYIQVELLTFVVLYVVLLLPFLLLVYNSIPSLFACQLNPLMFMLLCQCF